MLLGEVLGTRENASIQYRLHDARTGAYVFQDCSAESPQGRRSVCYDREALEARKKHRPENSAMQMASDMGAELLTEEPPFPFDTKRLASLGDGYILFSFQRQHRNRPLDRIDDPVFPDSKLQILFPFQLVVSLDGIARPAASIDGTDANDCAGRRSCRGPRE